MLIVFLSTYIYQSITSLHTLVYSNISPYSMTNNIQYKSNTVPEATKTISDYRWQKRIVIHKTQANKLPVIVDKLKTYKLGLHERKLLFIFITDNNTYTLDYPYTKTHPITQNQDTYTARLKGKNTILIGLDGGTKAFYSKLDIKQIYADIDAMPMRRGELSHVN